jgi:hypothetical protein
MGEAYGKQGDKKIRQEFWCGNVKEEAACKIYTYRKNNLKLDLKESGWDGVAWIHLAQDRAKKRAAVNTIMDLRFPQRLGNFLSR